ncbi:MAG: ATP synthase F1 subunit delta [Phycisphaerae bacterium]|jgi:F-type H+-transporting ATPase subunit delta
MSESIAEALPVADVYAAALFELASEANQISAVRAELEELARLAEMEPTFIAFLDSAAVDDDKRAASLEKMFRGRLSDMVLNTLLVMNRHGRAGMLAALLRCYVLREEHARGQIEVRATSAVELSVEQRQAVEQWAGEISGRDPLVEYVVDASVLGGVVVEIGDYRFDHSVQRHLHTARTRLLDRSDRGLKIGIEE